MMVEFWTTNGSDIWRVKKREVFDFKNLDTGEVVTCGSVTEVTDKLLKPIAMPKIKPGGGAPKAEEKAGSPRSKIKYKGVRRKGKRFAASYWDNENKKSVYLGMFDHELLAAAKIQQALGNKKEAERLLNEYQEGDPPVNLGQRPSEE